nr:unnamed protein product [Digitaria exilis]
MAQRSLDGLVTFLTCLFPYLPNAEALAYLDATGADALAAARLIVRRRGLWGFDIRAATTVDAVETALRYAAVAAKHPDPQLFVSRWKSISAGLAIFPSSPLYATRMIKTPKDNLELQESWALATGRLERLCPIGRELPPTRAAMKRMLLATIHGFYIKALGSLPKDELTHRYHRSLLLGGYCFGPLHPVENIIVNTIWGET